VYGLFTPECYQKMFVQFNLFDFQCLTFLMSKLIGYLIVTMALIVKVPQILKIQKAQSIQGLSLEMYVMELVGYGVTSAYNFRLGHPFSTYGENLFLFVQNCILIYQLLFYSKRLNSQNAGIAAGFAVFFSMIFSSRVISAGQMSVIQTTAVIIFAIARFPQIRNNYLAKSTGQLAFVTCLLNFLGGFGRLFTVLREVSDQIVLFAALSALTVNSVIIVQFAIYGKKSTQPVRAAAAATDSGAKPPTRMRPKRE